MADLKVVRRGNGAAFYIDGSLQFDTADEAVYHEALVLPGAALASARLGRPLRALVLGGGDGLALREVLGPAAAASATLVDYDAGVLRLGREEFAAYNRNAFADPRVRTVCDDARDFIARARLPYDLVVADFTFPSDLEGCSLFTSEFFRSLHRLVAPRGVLAMNAVSPEKFPAAYWAVYRTLREAGFFPRPLSADIPSFSSHGYGKWGFFFSSPRAISCPELSRLKLPPGTAWLNKEKLAAGMRFDRGLAAFGSGLARPLTAPAELLAYVNLPPPPPSGGEALDFFSNPVRLPGSGFSADPALWGADTLAAWEDRLRGILGAFDWEALLSPDSGLPADLAARLKLELQEFKADYLPSLPAGPRAERAYRVLAAMAVLLIVVNMAYPDNVYAKGSYGRRGGGSDAEFTFISSKAPTPFHNLAFMYLTPGRGLVADSAGRMYPSAAVALPPENSGETKTPGLPLFAVTADIHLAADGTAFMLLPHTPYALRLSGDVFVLVKSGSDSELFRFRPDVEILDSLMSNIVTQQRAVGKSISDFRRWLSWSSPAGVLLPNIRGEAAELERMLEIQKALDAAGGKLGRGPGPSAMVPGKVRLFPGVFADPVTGSLALLRDDGDLTSIALGPLPAEEEAVRLPQNQELEEFLKAVLKARGALLPELNQARVYGQYLTNGNQRIDPLPR